MISRLQSRILDVVKVGGGGIWKGFSSPLAPEKQLLLLMHEPPAAACVIRSICFDVRGGEVPNLWNLEYAFAPNVLPNRRSNSNSNKRINIYI